MADFEFLQNPLSKKWVILAPRRANRPDVAKGSEPVCPFCVGREKEEKELYRVQDGKGYIDWPASHQLSPLPDSASHWQAGQAIAGWQIRVVPNKFPFAPIHEVIVHSPDHHKNFGELSLSHTELILQTYRQRYNAHAKKGQVYIFHNRGEAGGESLPHPHTQLAVVPYEVKMDIARLASDANLQNVTKGQLNQETKYFILFCPKTSAWPDEIWISPKLRGRAFGEITPEEIKDFSFTLTRLIQILDLRHGHEFSYNFYIYPGGDWYMRIIPRLKVLGGFEIGTGIYVNTQDPQETIMFIKEHFEKPDEEKIKTIHKAFYRRGV